MTTPLRTALVVDDDPGILAVLELAMSELGFDPMVARDGQTALELARVRIPSVVLLDQRMPGKSGVEMLKEFRALLGQGTPIVLVTAGRHLESEARAAGASATLEKPFEIDVLTSTVERLTRCETILSA